MRPAPWWVAGPAIPWFAWRVLDEGGLLFTLLRKRRDPIFNGVYLLMTQFPSASVSQRSREAEDR